MKTDMIGNEVNLTIQEIFHLMHVGKTNNFAKVSLHVRDGVRWLCIHKSRFKAFEDCISYLREDGRSFLAPELRPAYFKKMGMINEMKNAEAELALVA